MLTLMGAPALETKPPFAEHKLSDMVLDSEGNVVSVTTVGPGCPAYGMDSDQDPWWDQPAQEDENA